MIRKAIIVVLTVAAVGTALSSLLPPWVTFLKVSKNPYLAVGRGPAFTIEVNYVDRRDPETVTGLIGPECRHKKAVGFELVYGNSTEHHLPEDRVYAVWALRANVPLWCPFALFAACPTITFIRGPLRRYRRRRRGLCLKCGYDLTGNVTGVCSECGEATRVR